MSFLGAMGVFLLINAAILFGPPHLPREDRVEVKRKSAPLPNSVDPSKIDALISAHSQWEKTTQGSPYSGKEVSSLVFRRDITGDGQTDEIRSDGCGWWIQYASGEVVAVRDPSVLASGATSVGLDDVDGDGFGDAWCCDPADNVVRILYGPVEKGFTAAQDLPGTSEYEGAIFDVDRDGDLDIVLREFKYGPDDKRIPTGEYSWIELEPKR